MLSHCEKTSTATAAAAATTITVAQDKREREGDGESNSIGTEAQHTPLSRFVNFLTATPAAL